MCNACIGIVCNSFSDIEDIVIFEKYKNYHSAENRLGYLEDTLLLPNVFPEKYVSTLSRNYTVVLTIFQF